jgi:carbon monoxide dehydrogenase subunit G
MELEHSFTVPVPEDRAWDVLLDVEQVAPCMPGATLDSVDGDEIKGRIKVKVGPINMTYAGTARFTERDQHAHVITLEASGKETRGAGTASAKVRSMLEGQDGQTHVIVHTTLNVTGRPAQFGRGVMAEVGGKLIGIFASNLADMLAAQSPPASADEVAGAGAGDGTAGEQEGDPAQAGGLPQEEGLPSEGDLSEPVESLNLPLRTYNSLRREGIHTVGDLTARTPEDLLAIENIGPVSVDEIRRKLAERGLALADSGPGGNGSAGLSAAPPGATATATAPAATATASAANGSGAAPAAQSAGSWSPPDDDAIDLLSVAGGPMLKRVVPVAVVAGVVGAVIVLGMRARRRRSRA